MRFLLDYKGVLVLLGRGLVRYHRLPIRRLGLLYALPVGAAKPHRFRNMLCSF